MEPVGFIFRPSWRRGVEPVRLQYKNERAPLQRHFSVRKTRYDCSALESFHAWARARERGVVAAASYEARQFGVHSAMPSITAKRKCPDLIFVKPRFDAYKTISLQIREIFAAYAPIIEPLSLDEAYLDVTENHKGIPSATQIAEEIHARIRAETALTASAGVSYNKFLAKIASDHRKPEGSKPWPISHGTGRSNALSFSGLPMDKITGLDARFRYVRAVSMRGVMQRGLRCYRHYTD